MLEVGSVPPSSQLEETSFKVFLFGVKLFGRISMSSQDEIVTNEKSVVHSWTDDSFLLYSAIAWRCLFINWMFYLFNFTAFLPAVEYCVRHLVQATFKNDSLIEFGQGFPATLLGNYVYLFIFIFLLNWILTELSHFVIVGSARMSLASLFCFLNVVVLQPTSLCHGVIGDFTSGTWPFIQQARINRTFWFFRFSGSKLN